MSSNLIAVGILRGPHGVKGLIRVESYSGETKHFFSLKEVILSKDKVKKNAVIEQVVQLGKNVGIKVKGFDSPEIARNLLNFEILVDRASATPLKKGEYYLSDLTGCELVYKGEPKAIIIGSITNTVHPMLEAEVIGTEKKTVLVPFLKQFVGDVDLQSKKIELLEDWFLE